MKYYQARNILQLDKILKVELSQKTYDLYRVHSGVDWVEVERVANDHKNGLPNE